MLRGSFVVLCVSSCAIAVAQESAQFNIGGKVIDESSPTPLVGARVILELWANVPPTTTFTTQSGLFSFSGVGRKNALAGRLIITRRNYDRAEVAVDASANKPFEIRLKRQPSQPATREQREGVVRSQPLQSFPTANWSGWVRVCSADLTPDERIGVTTFQLLGDRRCASWGECREVVHTDRQACWEFRVQGHNEWRFPSGAATQGELKYEIIRTIDPEAAQSTITQLWIQFRDSNRGQFAIGLVERLRQAGIKVAGIDRIDKPYEDAVKYFHEEDRERAERVLAETSAYRSSAGLPLALRLQFIPDFGNDVPLHHIELWIH